MFQGFFAIAGIQETHTTVHLTTGCISVLLHPLETCFRTGKAQLAHLALFSPTSLHLLSLDQFCRATRTTVPVIAKLFCLCTHSWRASRYMSQMGSFHFPDHPTSLCSSLVNKSTSIMSKGAPSVVNTVMSTSSTRTLLFSCSC